MRGNITKRGKSSWRLKLDVDKAAGSRKTTFKTIRGSRKDAERELAKLISATHDGTFVEASNLTVADHLRAWLSGAHSLAGKLQVEGKDYVVSDGDILHIRFNV